MASASEIAAQLAEPARLARFVVNPRAVASELGLDMNDVATVRSLERLAITAQQSLAAAAAGAGIPQRETLEWGIGAGCCNTTSVMFGSPGSR